MHRLVISIAALACLSTASSAANCWSAKQNWNQGNTMTCAFDGQFGIDDVGRPQGRSATPSVVVTEEPIVEEPTVAVVVEVSTQS
jgi:hypothetical protein